MNEVEIAPSVQRQFSGNGNGATVATSFNRSAQWVYSGGIADRFHITPELFFQATAPLNFPSQRPMLAVHWKVSLYGVFMNTDYWKNRWKRGEIGWHQKDAESRMTEYFTAIAPTRVFVPLCGKSLDLRWLHEQGHEVVGIELSEQGCREFFRESSIAFRESRSGPFTVFQGDRITIFNGDFFDLQPSHLGQVGAVYDRAALIALPPNSRGPYAQHMVRLIEESSRSEGFRFLQIVLERTPPDKDGPPFSVCPSEIWELYGARFAIRPISRESIEPVTTPGNITEECVYEFRHI
jgi:thiopurine S-methyltransferase